MKFKRILIIFAVLFTAFTSQAFAQENGVCVVLTMKYTEQYPAYTNIKARYDSISENQAPGWGGYSTSKTEVKKELDRQEAKLNKIKQTLKAANCYTSEDESAVSAQLK